MQDMRQEPEGEMSQEHNPDSLSKEQYGAPEWRLLREGEILTNGDQWFINKEDGWFDIRSFGRTADSFTTVTYRRRVSPILAEQSSQSARIARVEELTEEKNTYESHMLQAEGQVATLRAEVERLTGRLREVTTTMEVADKHIATLQRERDFWKEKAERQEGV